VIEGRSRLLPFARTQGEVRTDRVRSVACELEKLRKHRIVEIEDVSTIIDHVVKAYSKRGSEHATK
jgi:hypothetical protein